MEELPELDRNHFQNLEHVERLELSNLSGDHSPSISVPSPPSANCDPAADVSEIEARLSGILKSNGVTDFCFKRVPSDYYDRTFEERRDLLGAHSIDHLCKSMVMVNTQAPANIIDCSDRNNSKYYVVVVQYTARLNAEAIKKYLHVLNNGQISKKKFNMRLAPEETSQMLTGFEHNAVTCVGMKTDIPVIIDEAIVKLSPDFIWLGGGEVDLKLGIRTSDFVNFAKPFIVSCSN
ncbi:hypothetical protein SAY87_020543 [Trapa incisa]|uniref:YbaK/aminoacyl-tRNA synthetase-associated domain-containing protein n=1 Tax=Trapa incisa TaxID=236973 RepID=A0AAN7PUA7_9MYRT|nr:hypothetical protein SAY87_020543 [Trapa incisa]